MIEIYLLKIKEKIPIYKESEKSNFKTPSFKEYASLLSKQIVKCIAARKANCRIDGISVEYAVNGKPYIKEYPDIHFNISHSESVIAIAFSDNEIGIDIEKLKKPNYKVADRFFSESEKAYIKKSSNPDNAFFEIWTAKEAYTKFSGIGIGAGFSNISVKEAPTEKGSITFLYEDYMISFYSEYENEYKLIRIEEICQNENFEI